MHRFLLGGPSDVQTGSSQEGALPSKMLHKSGYFYPLETSLPGYQAFANQGFLFQPKSPNLKMFASRNMVTKIPSCLLLPGTERFEQGAQSSGLVDNKIEPNFKGIGLSS